MSVYKMVEVVGTSGTSVSDAIRGAVERAAQTLEDLTWFEVKEIRGRVAEGEITEYQVKLDIGFELHAPKRETGDTGSSIRDKRKAASTRATRSALAQVAAKGGQRRKPGIARGFQEQPGSRKR